MLGHMLYLELHYTSFSLIIKKKMMKIKICIKVSHYHTVILIDLISHVNFRTVRLLLSN